MTAHPAYITRSRGAEKLGITNSEWDKLVRSGKLPPPHIRLGRKPLKWRWRDVERSFYGEEFSSGKTQLYRYFDNGGRLLYVGISVCAVARLIAHKSTDKWSAEIARIEIENFPSRTKALEAEAQAIRAENPLYNVMHKEKITKSQ